jgi:hypothetical protein
VSTDDRPTGHARAKLFARRALPLVIAAVLVTLVLWRIDRQAFLASLAGANVPGYVGFTLAFVIALLGADTFATALVYAKVAPSITFRELFVIRGASYLPSLVNHHLGQAFVTVLLARRHGLGLGRAAGATLVCYASWAGALLGMGALGTLAAGRAPWFALGVGVAGTSYLAVLAARPARLARVAFLAPLFEAGVRGHLEALITRLPHVAVLFVGSWVPFSFFGVDVPLREAVVTVPILMVVVTLPITPAGFGTRDAVAATLLLPFAQGATVAEKTARIAAATTSFGVLLTVVEAGVGLALARAVARLPNRAEPPRADAS